MYYQVEPLEWETTFLGYPVGSMELPADFDAARLQASLRESQRSFRLIFVNLEDRGPDRLPSPDMPCICYDRKVVFKKAVPASPPPVDPHVKAYTSPICTRQMEQLAIKSGRHSRFKKDPELSPQYERLFLTWINNSVCSGLSDSIWTWRENGKMLGLMTLRYAKRTNPATGLLERETRIGMLAVHDEHRRRGIGSALLEVCDFWSNSLDIPVAALATQDDNEATCALCIKEGYEKTAEESVYHYWSPYWVYDPHRGWGRRLPPTAATTETATR